MTRENWIAAAGALFIAILIAIFGGRFTFTQPTEDIGYLELPPAPEIAQEATSTESLVASPAAAPETEPVRPADLFNEDLVPALEKLENSLVNIICITDGTNLKSTSGTGVVFDSRGLILTNAHIGQYFLLRDVIEEGTISCVIRTGSPARNTYLADIAYISSRWIKDNPYTLVEAMPAGTGEDDIAVLAITGTVSGASRPATLPSVPLSRTVLEISTPVAIGTYGAELLSTDEVRTSLYPTLIYGQVRDRFTFGTDTVDLISLGGSSAAQHGSSGGGVVGADQRLVGLVTTSSVTGPLLTRDLRAMTAGHIRRSFKRDTGADFEAYFSSKSLQGLVSSFEDTATLLGEFLLEAVNR